jgi:hypothetical protein
MDRVTEFRPTPQMLWMNILPGKRPDEAIVRSGNAGATLQQEGSGRKAAEKL